MIDFPSRRIEEAVNEFSRLPGVGKRTALRLVLHLLKQDAAQSERLADSVKRMRQEVKYCQVCHNVSDETVCAVCSNSSRDHSMICVVEDVRDFMAIENTGQYKGVYHVLGGIISPMDGIGPGDLQVDSLIQRVANGQVKEVLMALKTTMEEDTTNFYLYRKLKDFPIKLSQIARGIAVGDELEYADEVTLGRSIINRVPFENNFLKG